MVRPIRGKQAREHTDYHNEWKERIRRVAHPLYDSQPSGISSLTSLQPISHAAEREWADVACPRNNPVLPRAIKTPPQARMP